MSMDSANLTAGENLGGRGYGRVGGLHDMKWHYHECDMQSEQFHIETMDEAIEMGVGKKKQRVL